MDTLHNFNTLIYLVFTLAISLLPLYLYRKRWNEVIVVGIIIAYFFVLYSDFIFGKLSAYHDAKQHENNLMIFKQWLDAKVSFGWNPYMNAGEPIYLFSNSFLWGPWVFFCWLNKIINLDVHTLFNVYWVFQFINFCTGSFLLFLVLYDDFRVSLFCFVSLLFSGMFLVNLGQPTGLNTIYYFPYILFCFALLFKRNNSYGLPFIIIFLGIAVNHYLPHYLFLSVAVFILFSFLLRFSLFFQIWHFFLVNRILILFAVIVSLLALSPALFLYKEMQNYVSPTRGGNNLAGAITLNQTGEQPSVNAFLSGYKVFLSRTISYRGNIHHAFYFGIIPLFLFFLSFFQWRDKLFWPVFLSAVVILLLGTGNDFFGYRLLIRHVPTFNMLRHSFGLAQFATLLIICLCGYGLKELLTRDSVIFRHMLLPLITFFTAISMVLIFNGGNVVFFGLISVIIFNIAYFFREKLFRRDNSLFLRFLYLSIVLLLFLDLSWFYFNTRSLYPLNTDSVKLSAIKYPTKRSFSLPVSCLIPIDLCPLMFKEASLTHPDNDFIFLRNRRLDNMLRFFSYYQGYEAALGVNSPLLYVTNKAVILPRDVADEEIIQDIYYLNSLSGDRQVFFSEKDIDFGDINEEDIALGESSIEYIKTDNPNIFELAVDTQKEGFLVRLENFHRGWKAFVDGVRTKIYPANYAFQAIRIAEGKHRVVFCFTSPYQFLFYAHILCVFLNWIAFNYFLFFLGKNPSVKTS